MENHYFDEKWFYIGSAPIGQEEFPPLNALRVAPEMRDGYWPVVNAARNGWDLVEDHRGREGFIDGAWTKIQDLGPLPEGWSDTPPIPPDTRTPEDKRHDAYIAEADIFRDEAMSYQLEADAWRLEGNLEKAAEAEAERDEALKAYLAKKEEIRARYPDVEGE